MTVFTRQADGVRLTANGRDITDSIRTPEVTMLASAASARPVVPATDSASDKVPGGPPTGTGRRSPLSVAATWPHLSHG